MALGGYELGSLGSVTDSYSRRFAFPSMSESSDASLNKGFSSFWISQTSGIPSSSLKSGVPSLSVSVSATLHPQVPGSVLAVLSGHSSIPESGPDLAIVDVMDTLISPQQHGSVFGNIPISPVLIFRAFFDNQAA